MPRPRTTRTAKSSTSTAKATEAAKSTTAVKSTETTKSPEFVCSECGRTFTRAASLGAHRRQTHKIPGVTSRAGRKPAKAAATSTAAVGRRRRARRTTAPVSSAASNGTTNRDALLRTLFPGGIPAKESVIRSVNAWLDEAERLARLR
jgi:hypothetical protein